MVPTSGWGNSTTMSWVSYKEDQEQRGSSWFTSSFRITGPNPWEVKNHEGTCNGCPVAARRRGCDGDLNSRTGAGSQHAGTAGTCQRRAARESAESGAAEVVQGQHDDQLQRWQPALRRGL